MERLKERLQMAKQAFAALEEVLQSPGNKIVRDATIQRFEFTVEATWKLAQRYLLQIEGLDFGSPKTVFRGCFQTRLLSEQETSLLLTMVDDRNLTVHTYNEALAEQIFSRIPQYRQIMGNLISRMTTKII